MTFLPSYLDKNHIKIDTVARESSMEGGGGGRVHTSVLARSPDREEDG